MVPKIQIGDIFQIPLSQEEKAFGQYLHQSKMGPIIQIFDLISIHKPDLDKIVNSQLLFPPIITGLFATIKKGLWQIIGNRPITNFVHPKFVSTLYDYNTGKAGVWYLWDGDKEIRIGEALPENYKHLEFLIVWNPFSVVERIVTKEEPYPYKDLKLYNIFIPEI